MKLSKKGATLIELIVAFALVIVSSAYFYQTLTTVYDLYAKSKKETEEFIDKDYDIRIAYAYMHSDYNHNFFRNYILSDPAGILLKYKIVSIDSIDGYNKFKMRNETNASDEFYFTMSFQDYIEKYVKESDTGEIANLDDYCTYFYGSRCGSVSNLKDFLKAYSYKKINDDFFNVKLNSQYNFLYNDPYVGKTEKISDYVNMNWLANNYTKTDNELLSDIQSNSEYCIKNSNKCYGISRNEYPDYNTNWIKITDDIGNETYTLNYHNPLIIKTYDNEKILINNEKIASGSNINYGKTLNNTGTTMPIKINVSQKNCGIKIGTNNYISNDYNQLINIYIPINEEDIYLINNSSDICEFKVEN